MPDEKEPIPKFAARIKAKYPEYNDMDDTLLTQKILAKYPEYADMVDMSPLEPSKKKVGGEPSSDFFPASVSEVLSISIQGRKPKDEKNKFIKPLPVPISIDEGVRKDKKADSYWGGVWNTIVGGVGSAAGGVSDFINNQQEAFLDRYDRENGIPVGTSNAVRKRMKEKHGPNHPAMGGVDLPEGKIVENFINKARTASSSRENEEARSHLDITDGVSLDDVKALGFIAPKTAVDMAMGAATGGQSFFYQSVRDNNRELEESGMADVLTPNEKMLYLTFQGGVQAALEKFGLDKVLKSTGLSAKIKSKIANEIADELIKKGNKVTVDQVEKLAIQKASSLSSRIKSVGLKTATSFGYEGGTEGTQSIASDEIKLLTNKLKGTKIFDEDDIKANFFKNAINSAAVGGVFGGGAGGAVGVMSNTKKAVRKQVAKAVTKEDVQKVQQEINEQVEVGNITPQEAEAANITAQQYAEIASKIPEQIDSEKKYALIGGIQQREELQKAMEETQMEKDYVDPAFYEDYDSRLELLDAKLAQTNDYIDGIVSGKKPTYRKEGDTFIKTDAKGETEISKQHYELAVAIREEDAAKNKKPEVTPNEQKTFTFDHDEDVPEGLENTKPIHITETKDGKIEATYSGEQLVKAGLAEKAKEISEVKAAKILAKVDFPDTMQAMAEQDPIGTLKFIAEQAQGGRIEDMKRMNIPEDVINEAIALNPAAQPADVVPSGLQDDVVKIGEEMGTGKMPDVNEVYKTLEDEEGRQGGSWLDNEYGDARFESEQQARAYAEEVHGFLSGLAEQKEIPVYRAVAADDVDLSPYGVGESWSFDLGAAKEFGKKLGVPLSKVKIISAKVPSENVDWDAAVRQYHNFSDAHSSESEFELPIPSNRVIKNVTVQDFKTAKEVGHGVQVSVQPKSQPKQQTTPKGGEQPKKSSETTQVPEKQQEKVAGVTSEGEGGATVPPVSGPPTAEGGTAVPDDESLPERQFTKQMLRSDELSEKSKGEIAKTLNYVRQTNEMSIKEANEIIDYVGLDEAQNVVINDSGIKPVVRVTLGQILIKKYNELADQATSEADKNYYLDKTIQVATFVTEKLATEAGQQIQAFSLWSRLSPEGQLRAANQDMERQGKEKLRRREKDINKIGDKFQKANEEAAAEVTKSEKVSKKTKKTAQDKVDAAKKKRENLIKRFKGKKGGNLYSSPTGLTTEGIEFVGELVATYIQEGVAKVEIIVDKVIAHLKDLSGKVPNDEVKKNVTDIVREHVQKSEDKKIVAGVAELEKEINAIVKKHYTVPEDAKKSLTDKFVEKLGLDKAEADQLSKDIQDEFDKIASRKKRNILYNEKARFDKINRTLKGAKTPEQKTVADDIIKYSNLGAFENADLQSMLAEKFGLGQISTEQAAKLKELADKIQKAPEGSPKRDATEDLLAYRAKIKGNDLMETIQGVWYANVLSGYKTHEKNLVSTFFNSMGELGAEMAKDPKSIPYVMAGYINGVFRRGSVEARHTLATGRSPIHIKKIETPSTLERKDFKGGAINPGNWFKYVSRLMIAEDVLSFQGLKEARARQLARRYAQSEGYHTWTKKGWDRVNEILFHTKERMNEAKLQADEEGLTGLAKKRRVYELMEESRPTKMTEQAYGFAAHGTFNHESEGSLGALTNAVAQALDAVSVGGAKPLRYIVPFTRIITNVVNNSLDFTPVGLVRAARGVRGFRSFEDNQFTKGAFKELTNEERKSLVAKAAIGITLAAILQAMHVAGVITISGAGPEDEKKKRQLEQEGWQEYSIKVGNKWYSYKYTPLVFVTGFLGNMNDAQEYAVTEDDETFTKRLELAGWRIGGQVADMTWINSASTLLGSLTEKTPDKVSYGVNKALSSTAKGFIPFSGAISQTSQAAQNIFNMPQKQVTNSWQTLIQDIPIARNSLNDRINALGEPIVRDIDVLISKETTDPVWKFLLDNKGWVAPVNRGTLIIIDKNTQLERPTTDDEYYEFSKLRGQKIREDILKIVEAGAPIVRDGKVSKVSAPNMSEAEINKVLSGIEEQATKETKEELFGEKKETIADRREDKLNKRANKQQNKMFDNK